MTTNPQQMLAEQAITRRALGLPSGGEHFDAVRCIAEKLRSWGFDPGRYSPEDKPPQVHAAEQAIFAIDAALARLGDRPGEREDAARELLKKTRERIAKPLERILALRPREPLWLELRDRAEHARQAVRSAEVHMLRADPGEVLAARDQVLVAQAEERRIEREIRELAASASPPRDAPPPEVFGDHATRQLDILIRAGQPYQAIALACDSARDVASSPFKVALLVASEAQFAKPSAKLRECFELRAALIAELKEGK